MKRYTVITVSAAALALVACGKKSDDATVNMSNTSMVETTQESSVSMTPGATVSAGQAFANAAAASDAFEIETSKLALSTSKSASIRKFAQMMVDAHTASTAKLKTAASAASPAIMPDPTLTPEQQTKVDALRSKTGGDFDRAYATEQAAGHQQTLDTLRAYSASGDVPTLKSFAGELAPTVAAHLNMAKSLKP